VITRLMTHMCIINFILLYNNCFEQPMALFAINMVDFVVFFTDLLYRRSNIIIFRGYNDVE